LPVAFGVSGSIVAAAAGDGSVALLLVSSGLGLALVMGRYPVRRRLDNERRILNELPAYLDALTVCVEAGASLHAAFRITVEKAPLSPMRRVVERILQEIRLGRSRIESLNHVAALYDIEALGALFAALVQSEGQGMSLGGVLREQARQRATERQLRAEKAALKAPVKMLGPLVLCIFPCTFIVIAVPVVVRLMAEMR
jgi:tight adherence protein C